MRLPHWSDATTDRWLVVFAILAFVPLVYLRDGNALLQATDYLQRGGFHRLFLWRTVTTEHTLPLWTPWSFSGHPFQADPALATMYPILWLLLPFPEGVSLVLDVVVHMVIAASGMLALGRELGLRRSGAMMAAIAFTFSGYVVARELVGHVMYLQSAAYLPWILAGVEAGTRDGAVRPYARAGVFFGVQIVAGCIPNSWMTAWSIVLYQLARLPWRESAPWRAAARGLGIVFVVAAGLSAVQWIPTAELAGHSVRSTAGSAYAADVGFPPVHALLLLFPSLTLDGFSFRWESHGYIGILPILATVFVMRQWREARVRAFLLLIAVGIGFMLAAATPLFRIWYYAVPGYAALRAHARELLVVVFALCVLGGMGFDRLQREAAGRWLLPVAGVIAGLGVLIGGVPWWQAFVIIASALSLTVIRRHAAWAVPVSLMLLLADVSANALYYPTLFRLPLQVPPQEAQLERALAADPGIYRVWFPPMAFRRNAGYAIERSAVDGSEALALRDYHEVVHALADAPPNPLLIDALSPDAFTHRPDPFPLKILNVKYTVENDGATSRLLTNPHPCGPVMQPGEWAVLPNRAAVIAAMRESGFEPQRRVLFETPPDERPAPVSGTSGNARVTSYRANSIDVDIDQLRDGFVVLSEVFYPGWRATLDGHGTRLYRANAVLRAVFVPTGHHQLELVFQPTSFVIGVALSLATLLMLALVAARGCRARRQRL